MQATNKINYEITPFQSDKRLKLEEPCYIQDLPAEVAGHIFSFLSSKDLLRAEAVSKIFSYYLLAGRCFESLMVERNLNLKFSFSEKLHNPAKANYAVNVILKAFLKKASNYRDFEEEEDPSEQLRKEILKIFYLVKALFIKEEIDIFDENYSGDLVIRGLTNTNLTYFERAIDKKGTLASFIAVKVFQDEIFGFASKVYKPLLFKLAQLSTAKGDFKGLEALAKVCSEYTGKLFKKGNFAPPITWALSKFELALNDYGAKAPPELLLTISNILIKSDPNKYQEALDFLFMAEKSYKERVPGRLYKRMGDIYLILDEMEKALNCYEKAVAIYHERGFLTFPIPVSQEFISKETAIFAKSFTYTGFRKSSAKADLENYRDYYTAIFTAPLLVKMGDIEQERGNFKQASCHYESAITGFKAEGSKVKDIPSGLLKNCSKAFFNLGLEDLKANQLESASNNFERARFHFEDAELLENIGKAYFKLGHFTEAYRLYNLAISDDVPDNTLAKLQELH